MGVLRFDIKSILNEAKETAGVREYKPKNSQKKRKTPNKKWKNYMFRKKNTYYKLYLRDCKDINKCFFGNGKGLSENICCEKRYTSNAVGVFLSFEEKQSTLLYPLNVQFEMRLIMLVFNDVVRKRSST